ncbi:MAG: hydrogenase maturation nickel metallochaperone HypA [Promethearchaeota archaeon]
MHEFSLAQQILSTCLATAEHYSSVKKISKVLVQVGEFTLIVPETLRYCFAIVTKGSIAEGARLEIEKVPGKIRCNKCGYEGVAEYDENLPHIGLKLFECKKCKSPDTTIIEGREMKIKNMSVEE